MQSIDESEIYKNTILYDEEVGTYGVYVTYAQIDSSDNKTVNRPLIHVFDCECHLQRKEDKVHFCDSCGKLRELNMPPGNQACKFMCNFRISWLMGYLKKVRSMPDCEYKTNELEKVESLLRQKYY